MARLPEDSASPFRIFRRYLQADTSGGRDHEGHDRVALLVQHEGTNAFERESLTREVGLRGIRELGDGDEVQRVQMGTGRRQTIGGRRRAKPGVRKRQTIGRHPSAPGTLQGRRELPGTMMLAAGAMSIERHGCAPGWPGGAARWTSSAKSGVGTAVSRTAASGSPSATGSSTRSTTRASTTPASATWG